MKNILLTPSDEVDEANGADGVESGDEEDRVSKVLLQSSEIGSKESEQSMCCVVLYWVEISFQYWLFQTMENPLY